MAKRGLCLLVLFFFHFLLGMVAINTSATSFIEASCRETRYPALCVQCLSSYASTIQQSEQQLTRTALSVSLTRAQSTQMFVSKMLKVSGMKPGEYQAVRDCIANIGEAVTQLSRSIGELGHISGVVAQDFAWHMSNVQTWVSAALTRENTCLDGVARQVMDGNMKASIRNRVVDVAQVTSNALAFVDRFAATHPAAAAASNMP